MWCSFRFRAGERLLTFELVLTLGVILYIISYILYIVYYTLLLLYYYILSCSLLLSSFPSLPPIFLFPLLSIFCSAPNLSSVLFSSSDLFFFSPLPSPPSSTLLLLIYLPLPIFIQQSFPFSPLPSFLTPLLPSLPHLSFFLSQSSSSILPNPPLISFYTCRHLDILIYIPTVRPRMFYRSGWLRCVMVISVVFCFELLEDYWVSCWC